MYGAILVTNTLSVTIYTNRVKEIQLHGTENSDSTEQAYPLILLPGTPSRFQKSWDAT